jgi:hypothetical protein
MRHNYIIYDQCCGVNTYLSILDGFKILFYQIRQLAGVSLNM